jgi:hypothetical protein
VETSVVSACQRREKLRCPWPAITAIGWEAIVHVEGPAYRERNEQALVPHACKIVVVLDAIQSIAIGDDVLADEDLMRSLERSRNDQAPALVVERGKDDWGRGLLGDVFELWFWRLGACDADHRGWPCNVFAGHCSGSRGVVGLRGCRPLGLGLFAVRYAGCL